MTKITTILLLLLRLSCAIDVYYEIALRLGIFIYHDDDGDGCHIIILLIFRTYRVSSPLSGNFFRPSAKSNAKKKKKTL